MVLVEIDGLGNLSGYFREESLANDLIEAVVSIEKLKLEPESIRAKFNREPLYPESQSTRFIYVKISGLYKTTDRKAELLKKLALNVMAVMKKMVDTSLEGEYKVKVFCAPLVEVIECGFCEAEVKGNRQTMKFS